MFTAPGTSHSITPTSTVKLTELSDMEQSAYTSTSSAIISTSRKKQVILLSHKYIISKNYDKALQVLRTVVNIDLTSRDSWFVMRVIYYPQEKYCFAQQTIKRPLL